MISKEQLEAMEGVQMSALPAPIIRSLVLSSPLAWGKYALGDWVEPHPHLRYVESKIVRLDPEHPNTLARGQIMRLRCSQPPQTGKLCADSTLVLTRGGWRRHGELVPGDFVLDHHGQWKRVIAVSPPADASLLVTMTDGSQVKVHPNHEWVVNDRRRNPWKKRFERVTTIRMMLEGLLVHGKIGKRGSRFRWQLPVSGVVEGDRKEFLIPPYSLGVWLGDGTLGKAVITYQDSDYSMIQSMAKEGVVPTAHFVHKDTGVLTSSFGGGWYTKFGKLKRKRIPAEYLTASLEQRLELLAGLIDTDGTVHKRYPGHKSNRIAFSTAEKRLAMDVVTLVKTFGWRSSIVRSEPHTSSSGIVGKRVTWTVSFSPNRKIPCRLKRKQRPARAVQSKRVCIRSIVPCRAERGRCIQVEGGVYCVGRQLTPTHNSVLVSTCLPTWLLLRDPDLRIMIISFGDRRAHDLGLQTKNMFEFGGELNGLEIDKSTRSKEFWRVKGKRGYVLSAGIGGPVNGMPADVVIFDDPYRGPEEALNPAGRQRVERFATSVLAARLQKGGRMAIVHTRWSPSDLIGVSYAWERDSEVPWHTIRLQALPEVDQFDDESGELVQVAGESICESLKPRKFLEEIKAASPYYEWMSLWQNTPVSADGCLWTTDMFAKETFVDDWGPGWRKRDPKHVLVISIDPAMGSDLANGDYAAICAAGTQGTGTFTAEFELEVMGPEETIERLIRFIHRLPMEPDLIGFENIGFQDLIKDTGVKRLREAGILSKVIGLKPTMRNPMNGKEVVVRKPDRIAQTLDAFVRNRRCRYVRGRGTSIAIQQMESFPLKGHHDDGPDSLEMAFRLIRIAANTKRQLQEISSR